MPIRIPAKVRGLGQTYADGHEMMSIEVNKAESEGLPFRDGARMPVELVLESESYTAGLRATPRMPRVWMSPDLLDAEGERTTLSRVLAAHGFAKNQAVVLEVGGRQIRLYARSVA